MVLTFKFNASLPLRFVCPESALGRDQISPERGGFSWLAAGMISPLRLCFNKQNWRHGLSSEGTSGCTASNRMPAVSFLFNQNIVKSESLSYLYAGKRGNYLHFYTERRVKKNFSGCDFY